jgi:SAM-dependent methyltransferase
MPTKPATYEEATYASPWRLIRYPHRRRVSESIDLLTANDPGTVVDYGAGGGELIASLLADERGNGIETAIAYDPNEEATGRLRERLGDEPRAAVATSIEEVSAHLAGRGADAISCMGVLEHLPLRERRRFYDFCAEVLSPAGRVVIDVPVEIGPALVVKQFGRRVLKRRDREYERGELLRAVVGIRTVDPARFEAGGGPDFIFTHRGFDHRVFRDELERFQDVRDAVTTPIGWLPSWLCNQEVFYVTEARPRT